MSDSEAESELSLALHLAHEKVQAELQKMIGRAPEPFTGPRFIALASGPNRAARRGDMKRSVGYPVQTGNRATRRAGARKAWRQAKIKEIREVHKKAVEEKVR